MSSNNEDEDQKKLAPNDGVSSDSEDEEMLPQDSEGSSNGAGKNGDDRNFPIKLFDMLEELEKDGLDHIASWKPHGKCFGIHKPKEFFDQILLKWFRQTKFASFQRQLNLYGFKRITEGTDKGCYYHECFLKGKRSLANKIHRKRTGPRKPNYLSSSSLLSMNNNFAVAPSGDDSNRSLLQPNLSTLQLQIQLAQQSRAAMLADNEVLSRLGGLSNLNSFSSLNSSLTPSLPPSLSSLQSQQLLSSAVSPGRFGGLQDSHAPTQGPTLSELLNQLSAPLGSDFSRQSQSLQSNNSAQSQLASLLRQQAQLHESRLPTPVAQAPATNNDAVSSLLRDLQLRQQFPSLGGGLLSNLSLQQLSNNSNGPNNSNATDKALLDRLLNNFPKR